MEEISHQDFPLYPLCIALSLQRIFQYKVFKYDLIQLQPLVKYIRANIQQFLIIIMNTDILWFLMISFEDAIESTRSKLLHGLV